MKTQMQAMRDKINTMTPTEYLAYQTRKRALKEAKAAISKKRTGLMDAWKAQKDIEWGNVDSALYDPSAEAITTEILEGNKLFKGIAASDIGPYLSSTKGMMDVYTGTLKDFATRPVPVHEAIVPYKSKKYAPLSLTSRAKADFGLKAAAANSMQTETGDD